MDGKFFWFLVRKAANKMLAEAEKKRAGTNRQVPKAKQPELELESRLTRSWGQAMDFHEAAKS